MAIRFAPARRRRQNDRLNATGDDRRSRLLDSVRARVDERFDRDLERMREFLRMPSVSATGEGIRAVADATVGWVEDAGGRAELVETGGHPLVIGEIAGPAGAPRLLRYGMYDVQPAEESNWSSPPFAAEVRDLPDVGPAVVARGSANSKGSLASGLIAAEILRELDALPVTLVLMVEGEEELGSPNLPAAIEAHRDELAADAAFDLDLTEGLDGRPGLITGCKGLLTLELFVRAGEWGGPGISLHSSQEAWIASPAWALVHALASLTDEDERIAVEDLDEGAEAPSDDDRAAVSRLAALFDFDANLREARASRYRIDGSPEEMLEALLFRPTMNINGLISGYVGSGGKTIIPSEARATVDIRLVPRMDADTAAKAVRRHLDARGFGHVETRILETYPWAKSDPRNPVARAIEASYEQLGRVGLPYPLAPWCAPFFVFDRILGLQWASGGVGHAAGAHGPDEYAAVQGLKDHIVGTAAFLLSYAEDAGASREAGER